VIGLIRFGRCWFTSFATAALVGCATTASLMPPSPAPGGVNLSGRISIKIEPGLVNGETPPQSLTAQFELEGRPDDGLLSLSTPLGTLMAQARWVGDQAELTGPDGKRKAGSLEHLTNEALGQSIPVGAMMSWLQGRAASDAPSLPLSEPDLGFEQLGWRINLNRWNDRLIVATRDGAELVTVRVKLDPGPAPADLLAPIQRP
jgi:outer membrane lipoprotein LolB